MPFGPIGFFLAFGGGGVEKQHKDDLLHWTVKLGSCLLVLTKEGEAELE